MKNVLFIAAAAIFTFASCQKETMPSGTAGIQREIALRSADAITRSVIDGTVFPAGYDMLVSAYRNIASGGTGSGVSGNYFEGIHFTGNSEQQLWKEGKYWPLTGTLDFLCIASAGLKSADAGIVPSCTWGTGGNAAGMVVATVPDNSIAFDDILFGSANAQAYVQSGTPISFRHAMSAVVFTAKSNVAYDAATNVGITIDSITVDGAKYGGTLTVTNPAAGGGSGVLSASWTALNNSKEHVAARVWDAANTGAKRDEPALSAFNLSTTGTNLAGKPFGDAYVILPGQSATKFTVNYTQHNGFKADGTTGLDSRFQYQYTASGSWEQGKKHVYTITITMKDVSIVPSVVDWVDQTAINVPIG